MIIFNKEKRELMQYIASLPRVEQIRFVARAVLETNNRKLANYIMNEELNDLEYQKFKRYLRSVL